MVMKILILIFFEITESKITRGHNYRLVKKQSRLDVRNYSCTFIFIYLLWYNGIFAGQFGYVRIGIFQHRCCQAK